MKHLFALFITLTLSGCMTLQTDAVTRYGTFHAGTDWQKVTLGYEK